MATTWLLSDSIYHQWVAPYPSGIAQVMPISAGYTATMAAATITTAPNPTRHPER